MKKIETFTLDETRFLSNFYPHKKNGGYYPHKIKIIYDDMVFDCVENAYQAAKSLNKEIRLRIRDMTPYEAKDFSMAGYEIRKDWKKVKLKIMYDLVWQKFANHKDMRDMLLATGGVILEEGNDWDDTFWGICKGNGKNHLGHILMDIREKLKKPE